MSDDPMSWALLRIEELESRCKQLEKDILDIMDTYQKCAMNRDKFKEERDEARLLYCDKLSPIDPHRVAEKWRWDCFKNEKETFWDALDRVRNTPSRTQAMDRLAKLDEELGLND